MLCFNSSVVGLHSSVCGTASNLKGVSKWEIISLRLYLFTTGSGGERGWSSRGGIVSSDRLILQFLVVLRCVAVRLGLKAVQS